MTFHSERANREVTHDKVKISNHRVELILSGTVIVDDNAKSKNIKRQPDKQKVNKAQHRLRNTNHT